MELAAFIFMIVVGGIIVGLGVGYLVEHNKNSLVPLATGTSSGYVDGSMYAQENATASPYDNYVSGSKGDYNLNPFV